MKGFRRPRTKGNGTGGFMIYDAMYEIPMELDVYRKLNMLGTGY